MRYWIEDPANSERVIVVPPNVVNEIREDALDAARGRATGGAMFSLVTLNQFAREGFVLGWNEALDAAREAVRAVNWFNDEGKMLSAVVATADSIAAIDALRGDSND